MKTNSKKLSSKTFRKLFFRSCTLDSAWNYERQQNLMYAYTMIPVLKELYADKPEEMKKALKRHLAFMGCTPHLVTLLVGISTAMEEKNVEDEKFDDKSIDTVKTSLMGPVSGIGDSFFWGTLLTIAIGIGVSFAKEGSILGPILFLLIINITGFTARYFCLKYGYKYGTKIFGSRSSAEKIGKITKFTSIIGLMVIGAMIASTVKIAIPIHIGVSGTKNTIQTYLDQIMPGLLPVLLFGLIYYLLGKKVKPTTILIAIIIISCVGAYFGIFGV